MLSMPTGNNLDLSGPSVQEQYEQMSSSLAPFAFEGLNVLMHPVHLQHCCCMSHLNSAVTIKLCSVVFAAVIAETKVDFLRLGH